MSIIGSIFLLDDILKNNRCNVVNAPNVKVIYDVVYDESMPELLTADLYMPTEPCGKMRVLINIHGGGWISGDKKWRAGFSTIMCDGKHFVMNINYGLSPQYRYPYCIANAYAALEYVARMASTYNLDLDNIYISGDSAGAQIASLVAALINNDTALAELNITKPSVKIRGLMLMCGAYDMIPLMRMPMSLNMCEEITGYSAKDIDKFNMRHFMSCNDYIDSSFPPSLVVVAKLDSIVPKQEKKLIEKLDANNIPYHLFVSRKLAASAHCFHLYHDLSDSREALQLALKHINGELIDSSSQQSVTVE